jgi:hypothetical protein
MLPPDILAAENFCMIIENLTFHQCSSALAVKMARGIALTTAF